MIELYLSKVTEDSESEQAGKLYARVSYKQAMDIHDMAHHMAEHNTAFSEGLIVGVLTDFVKCTREMVLSGNTVKVGNLAIFKATVEANALDTLYDAEQDKTASATIALYEDHKIFHYRGGNCELLEEELKQLKPAHDDIKNALADAISISVAPRKRSIGTAGEIQLRPLSRFGGI